MTGAITYESVGMVFAVVCAAYFVWRTFNKRADDLQKEHRAALLALEKDTEQATAALRMDLQAQILALQTDLASLRTQVLRDYASVQHLEKVENRLIDAINRLTDKFEGVREALLARAGIDPQALRP